MTSTEAGRLAGRAAASREPLSRAERLHLTVLAGAFALVAAMFGAGAIALNNVSVQILGLRAEMREEIGGLRAEMHEGIGGLRTEMSEEILGLRAEMREEIGQLSDRLDQLSDRMGQVSDRLTRVETLIETHLVPASNVRNPAGL